MSVRQRIGALVFVLGLAACLLVPTARAAEEKSKATGTWKSTFTRGDRKFEVTYKLKQEGDKLTGTVSGRNNTETKIEDGTAKDGKISFKVTREFNGNKFTQTYKGEVKGDTIEGKIEFERNGETQSRDWKATREK